MHRGLRPLGAAALPPALKAAALPGNGDAAGKVSGGDGDDGGGGVEGSRAAAKAVEGFIRTNIEEYFGCWTSTYTLFSLDPRLVSVFVMCVCVLVVVLLYSTLVLCLRLSLRVEHGYEYL